MKRFMLVTAAIGLAACGNEEPGRLPIVAEPVEVRVSTAQKAPSVESFPAVVTSERTAEIATRMSGTVDRVSVDVGSRVRRGDALVALDANDIEARVAAARAQEQLAGRSFTRIENLHRDGAASQQELDQATAGLEAARAQLAEAEAQQAYAVVRAPFDGLVTQRSVDPGDLALPGHPLLTLVAPGALKITADLPAARAGSLEVGGTARVWVDGATHDVKITRVVSALGRGSHTFRVEAVLLGSADGLIPGTYGRLEVAREGEGPRWIPADAVIERGQLTGVYAIESDTARLRWVRLGQRRDGAVELLAAPAGELTVVRAPAPELFDGRPVSAVHAQAWAAPGGEVEVASEQRTAAVSGEEDR